MNDHNGRCARTNLRLTGGGAGLACTCSSDELEPAHSVRGDETETSLFERFQEYGADPDHYTYAEWCNLYIFLKKG